MTKSGRGAPRAPVRSDSHPAGGVGPACRSIRGRIRASTGPLVRLALPAPLGQRGGRQPSPPAVRGGIWADVSPLGRMQEISLSRGPKGSLEPLRIQWRARLPGPSGCPALRRTAHGLTRGRAEAWNRPRNQWRAKPESPCTACRLRGVQGPPWSIFGHFLLIKKVATPASGFCLTFSQTTNIIHGTN